MKVTEHNKMQHGMQTWVEVHIEKKRTIMIEHFHGLQNNLKCLAGTGKVDVKPDQRFKILVANFNENAVDLLPHQVVAYGTKKPERIIKYAITHWK